MLNKIKSVISKRLVIIILLVVFIIFSAYVLASQFVKVDEPTIVHNGFGDVILTCFSFNAMAVNPWIIIIDSGFDKDSIGYNAELTHEITHVEQMNEMGYVRWAIDVTISKIKNRSLSDIDSWYEKEAYAEQKRVYEYYLNK